MKEWIADRINRLREEMKKSGVDVYYIATDDFHGSEFVGEYFKVREYLSGFTGSAGTLIVTMDEAVLYTDGRYFIQAEKELAGTGVRLMKEGMTGVPDINRYLYEIMQEGMTMGFDGRCVKAQLILSIKRFFDMRGRKIILNGNLNLADVIWTERPAISTDRVYILDEKYSGESAVSKLERIREWLAARKADVYIVSSLDDIAWTLNLRGSDVKYSPVFLAYMIITLDTAILYCGTGEGKDKKLLEVRDYLMECGVEIRAYDSIYSDISTFDSGDKHVILDYDKINYRIYSGIKGCRITNVINPTTQFKAVKNLCEIENERQAHIKDAVAYVKFLYWFKKELNTDAVLTEISVADRLCGQRMQMEGFVEESFEAISAYGSNGAIVHYSPDEESNAVIERKSFLLMDTGGHYLNGTTDITRTIACGELAEEEKIHYTLVLKGNLALGNAVFLEGTTGANLDILARQYLWENGLDYKHGTGHGVGYLLNVHEGPNNISFRLGNGKRISAGIQEGMITSNEPGLYLEGKYGIRLENMMVCRKREETEFGTFLEFETLTLVPFERSAIKSDMLTEKEKDTLNRYHKRIYDTLSEYLNQEEREFLREITKEC